MVQKKKRSSQICKKALWKKPHPHERVKAVTPLKLPLLLLKPRNKNSAGKGIPVYLAYSCYAVMQGFTTSLTGKKPHAHTHKLIFNMNNIPILALLRVVQPRREDFH